MGTGRIRKIPWPAAHVAYTLLNAHLTWRTTPLAEKAGKIK